MRLLHRAPGRLLVTAILGLLMIAAAAPAPAGAESYSKQTLHFLVHVGPNAATPCKIVGDLYRPADATASHPDPAVLTTNGFGGSKADQATLAGELAAQGYVVLSYSGLGFGGSGCPIELDDPAWDGAAASQLVTFLGGGGAAIDGTRVDYVVHDRTAHDGRRYADDPRVGMIGGSYGGEVQFAAAEQDPRIDTIVPLITWNDLSYSLAPNNAGLTGGGVTTAEPGDFKFIWGLFFFADGAAVSGLRALGTDPSSTLSSCPNFNPQVCGDAVNAALTGAPNPATVALFRHASVASYSSHIRIPTLLGQGENDTLFTLHEALATYNSLRAQHTPVKLVWQSWGHSGATPAPGELGDGTGGYAAYDAQGHITYEGQTILQWFNHYLKRDPLTPSLDFSFFRPWVTYSGDAAPAFGRSASFPIGRPEQLDLSGSASLVPAGSPVSSGSSTFSTTAAGAPTSYSEISAVDPGKEPFDLKGSYAEYATAPLSAATDVVGIPSVTVHVDAPLQAHGGGGPGDLALFLKLYDLSPSGLITLPDKLIAPVRIANGEATVQVALPGIVHRFAAGDRIALVIAGGDSAYRGNLLASPVTIATSAASPGVLSLPVAPPSSYGPVIYASDPVAQIHVTTLSKRSARRGRYRLRWSGSDRGGGGLTSFTVQERTLRRGRPSRWRTLRAVARGRRGTLVFAGARVRGGRYQFRVRSTDAGGVTSRWAVLGARG